MPYCFHCNKEVKDMYKCPNCGRELLPDVNFVNHGETHEEKFLKEIRRKKLKEVYEKNQNFYDYFTSEKEKNRSLPKNFTSVRQNPKHIKKE
ncbi:MAG: hypothetical protein ACLFVB_05980 [Thermoplasmata archaeon]